MPSEYLVDTNIVVAFFESERPVVEQFVEETRLSVSVVTIGELYFGAEKSAQREENEAKIERLFELGYSTRN
jgi:tRNA(fMet)-specific endonuclease VapC